jgi:hypothetical protein
LKPVFAGLGFVYNQQAVLSGAGVVELVGGVEDGTMGVGGVPLLALASATVSDVKGIAGNAPSLL